MLGHFEVQPAYIIKVPVCASYCNNWFEACKDDMTCYDNWFDSLFQALKEGPHDCSEGGECRTFMEIFGDGEGLCNRLWGDAFV